MFTVVWNWIITLFFGTGAAITPTPVDIPPGESFLRAPKALRPVNDTMSVGIDLGKVTEQKKKHVLLGTLNLSEIGRVEVAVCKSKTECVPMVYSGGYFSREAYGIGFVATGGQLKNSSFVAVKIRVERPLNGVVVSWSNYTQ